jgi:phage repressor protein C with HTH and peptisase S24 domain/transcriptional regulator with XRE-family HTH domain
MAARKTFGELVYERRGKRNATQEEIAEAVGIRAGYLSRIERGKVPPPSDRVCHKLERTLGLEPGELVRLAHVERLPTDMRRLVAFQEELQQAELWIQEELSQRGRELPVDLPTEELRRRWEVVVGEVEAELLQRYRSWSEAQRGLLGGSFRRLAQTQGEVLVLRAELMREVAARGEGGRDLGGAYESGRLAQLVEKLQGNVEAVTGLGERIPVINKVAAGYPTEFTDLGYPVGVADEYVYCPGVDDPNAFAIRVCGDSMEPRYREGDILIISPAVAVHSGDDCFVRIEGTEESTLKRVFFDEEDTVRLQPLNERYPPQVFPRSQLAALYRAVRRLENL